MANYTINVASFRYVKITLFSVPITALVIDIPYSVNNGDKLTLTKDFGNFPNVAVHGGLSVGNNAYNTVYNEIISTPTSYEDATGGIALRLRSIQNHNKNWANRGTSIVETSGNYNLVHSSTSLGGAGVTSFFSPCIMLYSTIDEKYLYFSDFTIGFGVGTDLSPYSVQNLTTYPIAAIDGLPNLLESSAVTYVRGKLSNDDFIVPIDAQTDPYSGAGDSDTGGGDGTFDGTSDPVPIPSLPSVGATDSGFITLFAPTVSQLKDLAHYMWINPLFDVETGFKKLFSDPMDCILGLSVVPVAIPTGGAQNVNIGNLVTSVSMNVASQQYVEVDCGSISFTNKFFGSYLDYEPYTKMAIFVPYSGIHSLCADDIMGKTIQLVYHIDILTGSLVAFLKCGDSVLYEFNGACGSNIPVNSLNYASTIENAVRIAVNIGTTVATAGAAAPAAMGAEAVGGAMTARNIATGINIAGSTAEGALSLKPNIDRAGSLGGTTGLLGNQTPYIIITRPRLCKPKDQNKIKGYPSFITCTLGDLDGKGYTEIDTVILNNIYLTDAEKDELIGVLKGGVYL